VEWRNETTYDHEAIHLLHSIGRNGLHKAPDDLINAIIEDLPNILDKIRREGVNSRSQLQEQNKQERERIIATCKKKNKQYEAINQYGLEGESIGRGLNLDERRIIERFLLFPKTINGETRWLRRVKMSQKVGNKEDITGHFQPYWYDEMWIDD
jgi:tRNA nucleotidyltransferase (CCA-adding enzyme)